MLCSMMAWFKSVVRWASLIAFQSSRAIDAGVILPILCRTPSPANLPRGLHPLLLSI
jgi:hypothetical protein